MIRFADVIGHGRAIATLQGAIQRGKVHHAYLLTGPPGIGRGSVARAMAAALLCHSGGVDACGACKPCQQLKAGAQADLRILGGDGKAVKVAEVRELIRWVALKPMGGKGRVAIVEEAQEQMLGADEVMAQANRFIAATRDDLLHLGRKSSAAIHCDKI